MADEMKKCPLSIMSTTPIIDCIGPDCQIWVDATPITKPGSTDLQLPEGCGIKRELVGRQINGS
jgi:hypothetical protein